MIRNCDEVGLFEDLHLQHNPFDETFRRAVESKSTASTPNHNDMSGSIMLHEALKEEETLHTPHVLPFYNLTSDCNYELDLSSPTTKVDSNIPLDNPPVNNETMHNKCTKTKMIEVNKKNRKPQKMLKILPKAVETIGLMSNQNVVPKLINNSSMPQEILPKLIQLKNPTFHLQLLTPASNIPTYSLATTQKLILLPKPDTENNHLINSTKSIREKLKESLLKSSKSNQTNHINSHQPQPSMVGSNDLLPATNNILQTKSTVSSKQTNSNFNKKAPKQKNEKEAKMKMEFSQAASRRYR